MLDFQTVAAHLRDIPADERGDTRAELASIANAPHGGSVTLETSIKARMMATALDWMDRGRDPLDVLRVIDAAGRLDGTPAASGVPLARRLEALPRTRTKAA